MATPQLKHLKTNERLPELAQAANLALQMMRPAKAERITELTPTSMTRFVISDEQRALMQKHMDVLALLHLPRSGSTSSVGVTVASCDKCGRWILCSTKSAAPKRCSMRLGCSGQMFKASTAAPRA